MPSLTTSSLTMPTMPAGTVRVQLFASLREHHGWSEKTVPLAGATTVAALQQQLRIGSDGISCAVNQEFALPTLALQPGDEVAFLPPISGG